VHGSLCRRRGVLSATVTEPRLLRTQNLCLCRLRRRARACAPQNLCGTRHRERAPPARPHGRLSCEARTSTAVGEFLRLLYSAHWLTAVSPYSGVPSLGEASGCGTAARAALGEASERAALSPRPPVALRSSARVRWCARSLLAASERCTRRRRVRLSRTLDCWPRGEPATGVGDAEPPSSSRSRLSAQALRSLCAAGVRRSRGTGGWRAAANALGDAARRQVHPRMPRIEPQHLRAQQARRVAADGLRGEGGRPRGAVLRADAALLRVEQLRPRGRRPALHGERPGGAAPARTPPLRAPAAAEPAGRLGLAPSVGASQRRPSRVRPRGATTSDEGGARVKEGRWWCAVRALRRRLRQPTSASLRSISVAPTVLGRQPPASTVKLRECWTTEAVPASADGHEKASG